MTNEELRQALTQQRREQVDVNIGQVSLRPTAQPGGQYGVQVRATPKENSYTELSKALNQFPQVAGQYANIQRAAGQREIEGLSPEELEEQAINGDHAARETILNRFKSEGINEALFKARYETVIFPGLAAKEQEFKDLNPEQVEKLFHDANGNPLKSEDIIENLRVQFSSVIPEDVRTNPNQKVMYNKLLRQLNGVATKSYAVLEEKRQKFLDDSIVSGISKSANTFRMSIPLTASEDNLEITNNAGVKLVTSGDTVLPSISKDDTQPQVVRNKISVYSPQQKGERKKMEGGYKSSIPGADGKSIVRTLEDFRKDPENTVVTVAGNPEFYGRRYVVESMTYQTADGKQYTLSNVPVMVHDTGGRFKTAPEGRFDIPVERDTDNKSMNINQGLLKDIQFIRDKGSESGTPVKVKRTAAEVTKQRSADVAFKQDVLTDDIFDSMNQTHSLAVGSLPKGSSLTPDKIRNQTEIAWERKLTDMALNGQHVQVQEFIDRASGTGPNGKVIKPELFAGEPISPVMLSNLRGVVRREERRLETEDPKRTEAEEKALEEYYRRLGRISADARNKSLEESNKAIAALNSEFEEEALKNKYSRDTKKEYYSDVRLVEDNLINRLDAGEQWDGLYLTEDFLERLDAARDERQSFQEQLKGEMELLRVAQIEGLELDELRDFQENVYSTLSQQRRERWDSITNGIMGSAMTAAQPEAIRELAKIYQLNGERNPKADILVPDQDEDGNEIEGKQVRAGVLYQKLLRRYMTKELIDKINDTKEQKRLINEARRIKGRTVEAVKDPLERGKQAEKLEKEQGRDDFLDKEGQSTRQYGKRDDSFAGNDGRFLDRWVKTAENPEALALMDAQTPREKLDSDLDNVFRRVTPLYLRNAAVLITNKSRTASERLERRRRLESHLQYIGIPMDIHEKNLLIKYPKFLKGAFSLFDFDLNRGDRYSDPATAKTHVYNYYAIRDTRFPASDDYDPYEKLNRLYDIYFKGQEATYPRETFFADQEALGKQIKLNPSK